MVPMDTPGFRSAVLLDPRGAAFSVSQIVPEARSVMTVPAPRYRSPAAAWLIRRIPFFKAGQGTPS